MKRWTKEEDNVLIKQVTLYPYNLREAFKAASRLLETRSVAACEIHWYTKLQKKTDVCFITIGKGCKGINKKQGSFVKESVSWWNKLLKFLKIK